jgi:uncharacterized protein YcaQ
LEEDEVESERYIWPAADADWRDEGVPRDVRLLAPFDPLVWDRRRFEHLWGWAYRFEAYTPAPRRIFGYYALPMLWGEAVIGWANVNLPGGKLDVTLSYAEACPQGKAFRRALDAELARMEHFLTARKRSGIRHDEERGPG